MDAYMGNLRHSHLAPHDPLAAEAEPVATTTTAPSVKLHKEADNLSLRSESDVAPSSSAPRIGVGAWQIMPAKDATSSTMSNYYEKIKR